MLSGLKQLNTFPAFLLQRRKLRRIHKITIDVVRQRAVYFRLGLYLLPFRIVLKISPILFRILATWMLDDINKKILRIGCIFGNPIANALHMVSSENCIGVVAK